MAQTQLDVSPAGVGFLVNAEQDFIRKTASAAELMRKGGSREGRT
jgi:hypothetical protein